MKKFTVLFVLVLILASLAAGTVFADEVTKVRIGIGTDAGYEYFREISELMTKRFPRNPVFIDNIGSYWLVAKNNEKQAVKFYKKALKIDPQDEAATRNLKIIERRQAQAKGKKK